MSAEARASGAHGPAAGRLALLVAVLLVAALVAGSGAVHARILGVIARAEPLIGAHPVGGGLLFMGLAALSALFVFFSSVVLVPIGVAAWGTGGCLLLLWSGWLLGSAVAYVVGRQLGRRIVERLVPPARLAALERRIPEGRSFRSALVIQLVLQSDVAGYLFGLVAWPVPAYLGAVAVAEMMFAVTTVFLGAAFVRGESLLLLAAAVLAGAVLLWRRGVSRRHARAA